MDNKKVNIIDAVKDAFTRFADFSGVSTRPQYWYFVLADAIASGVVTLTAGDMAQNVLSLITLLPNISVAVRRMHDVGKSGWFILVPIYNIVLLASPSKGVVE
ncbi:unannotated protein [freshwater metagenome]|jgi:uncharacterized membrane protein YhaH (DUF805 family)|uniref:Unannotated protein n=1 Tax=freshwater metagenome TaxID=449393 RepID=A0A6J7EE99_9ZZZZ|nr:DUF805 domain-containing protein [Actinomycetota bacterium]MTA37334.1 DUF805 domain-containing protein [Actinomycetota bacterium]